MANITAYTTTSGLLVDPSTPNPLAPYTLAQLLQNDLVGLANFNYYAAQEYQKGLYTVGVATDGSFYIDTPTYHINAYGTYGYQGSNINHYVYTYKTTGAVLDGYGTFTYSGLPWVSNLTSGNITKILNTWHVTSATSAQDTILGNLTYIGNGIYSGNITSFQEVTWDVATNKGTGYYYDGTAATSVNGYAPSLTTVSSGVITSNGAMLVNGSTITDSIVGSGFSGSINTKIGDLKVNTGDDVYTLTGTMGISLNTNTGNDIINIQTPNNIITGDAGTDTAVFANSNLRYTVKFFGSTNATVIDNLSSTDTNNSLSTVETIAFSDGSIQTAWFDGAMALARNSPEKFAVVTQMYLAYFNRAPDAVGLDYWANNVSQGWTNLQVANTFATTPEAIATYGTVTAQSSTAELTNFVNGVYTNVLNRTPDAGGLNYWVNNLKTGASTPGGFILDIITAVNAQTGTADKLYLSSKTAVASHFAVTDGLTNVTQAKTLMTSFNNAYTSSGATTAISTANALSDGYLSHVTTTPELVIQLVGVNV